MKGIADAYNGTIPEMRRKGYPLQKIADRCDVSRERVRQVLNKYYPNARPGSLTESEAARVLECSAYLLTQMRQRGSVSPKRYGHYWVYSNKDIEIARQALQRCCVHCGRRISTTSRNFKYCPECSDRRRRYRYWLDDWRKRGQGQRRAFQKYKSRKRREYWDSKPRYELRYGECKGKLVTGVNCTGRFILLADGQEIPKWFVRRAPVTAGDTRS